MYVNICRQAGFFHRDRLCIYHYGTEPAGCPSLHAADCYFIAWHIMIVIAALRHITRRKTKLVLPLMTSDAPPKDKHAVDTYTPRQDSDWWRQLSSADRLCHSLILPDVLACCSSGSQDYMLVTCSMQTPVP